MFDQSRVAGSASARRPRSVTVLAILAALGGIAAVLGVFAGAVVHGAGSPDAIEMIIILGALVLASLYLALGYRAWTLKSWGWSLGLVTGVASIVYMTAVLIRGWSDLLVDAPPLALVGLLVVAIAAVGLFFWFRPEVRRAFGGA